MIHTIKPIAELSLAEIRALAHAEADRLDEDANPFVPGTKQFVFYELCYFAAARAYDSFAVETHGEFARLNFPKPRMFVYLVPASAYPAQTGAAKGHFGEGAMVPYNAYMAIKNANETVSTWAPSVGDCLAEDWSVIA